MTFGLSLSPIIDQLVQLSQVVLMLAFLSVGSRFNYAKLTLINLGWNNNKKQLRNKN